MVTLISCMPASASWYMPPPPTAAVLPEIVVFSMTPPPSLIDTMPPPRPSSSRGPFVARLFRISEPRITSVESDWLANPPPFSATLRWIVVSRTVNSPLDELWMPPPSAVAVLSSTSHRSKVAFAPPCSMPPPEHSSQVTVLPRTRCR